MNLVSLHPPLCQEFGTFSLVGRGTTGFFNWFPATGEVETKLMVAGVFGELCRMSVAGSSERRRHSRQVDNCSAWLPGSPGFAKRR